MPLLKILSNSERLRFDTPPVFDSEERKRFFNLPRTLESSLENLRSAENQILFILQFGYFRSRQRFFAGHFHLADLEYVSAKFDIPIENSENLSYSRSSILRQQKIILDHFGVRVISQSDEITLLEEATELVKTVVRPVKIFWQLVEKITNLKMVLPTHHWLTNLISKAIQIHEKELVSIIEESLSSEQKVLLDSLLSSDENDSESVPDVNLASLKQPFHSLKATHIKANLTDWQFLQSIYQSIAPVISKLDLSGEAIRFYAQTVHKTDALHMARRQDKSRYLHLLAFVAYQSFRLQDMLVDSLLQSVQNATNAATQEYRGQYFQKRLEQRKTLNDLLKSIQTQVFPTFDNISKVLADKESSVLRKLERIETAINENLLERQRLELEIDQLAKATDGDRDDKEFYAILQKKSLTPQRRASDIIRFLKVDEKTISQPLFDALRNFQKKDRNIEKNAPQEFLTSKEKEFFDENKFSVSLYKALLFQNIAGGIKSGTVNFNDSHKYRILDDYLIPKAVWKNKSPELPAKLRS